MGDHQDDQHLPYEEEMPAHYAEERAQALPPMEARPARRRIGAFDEPGERVINLGIPTPTVANNNFELKTSLINMVQGTKFYGLPSENPLHHLDAFERLCRTVKINGVPQDAIKMMLFPFSLGDRASQWENNIRSELVSTWPMVKKEFTKQFFPKQKTAKIRHDITTFKQGHNESFYEAWERMKGYTRSCPHHGVEMDALLGIFHGGVLEKYRIALDTASYGSFANLDVEQGERLIENLAQSDQCYAGDYDRSIRESRPEDRRLKEITDKLDRLDKVLHSNQKHVHFVDQNEGYQQEYMEDSQDSYGEISEEINYLGNQGGYQARPAHPNLSYRSPNVENPQDQTYPPYQKQPGSNFQNQGQNFQRKPEFQQGNRPYAPPGHNNFQRNQFYNRDNVQGGPNYQNRSYGNFNSQGQSNNSNWNNKPAYGNFKGNASSSAPQQDDDVKSMLRQLLDGQGSNKKEISDLNAKFEGLATHVRGLENQIAQVASPSNNKGKGVFPGKPEPNPKEFCNVITLRSGKELSQEETKVKESETKEEQTKGTINPQQTDQSIQAEKSHEKMDPEEKKNGKAKLEDTERKNESVPPPYEPKLPFPGRFKKEILDKQFSKFKKLLETVQVTLPLTDLLNDCPTYSKMLKDIITKKKMLEEAMIEVNHECSAIIQRNLPKKLRDPGSFTLPCKIGEFAFHKCLVDLGASVSLMPYTLSKKLGLTNFKKTRISLVLADRSIRSPVGILEDIPIKVGDCIVPTDFIVLEMEEEPTDPIILGRPFLATAGAIIDVKKGVIDLHLGDTVLKFDILDIMKKPTIEKEVFYIEEMEQLADEFLEELINEDSLQAALTLEDTGKRSLHQEIDEFRKILDSHPPMKQGMKPYEQIEKEGLNEKAGTGKTSNDDWNKLNAPKIELKQLPNGLRYVFLGKNSTYPIIINDS